MKSPNKSVRGASRLGGGGKGEEQTVDCGLRFRKADGELSPVFGGVSIGPRASTRPVGVCSYATRCQC